MVSIPGILGRAGVFKSIQTHELGAIMASKTPSVEAASDAAPVAKPVELGLDTFGDVEVDAAGEKVPYPQVIRNVVEQAVLADQVGVDFFGIGEHHRDDFAI